MGNIRFVIAALLCLTPIVYRYLVGSETYIIYNDIRFAILMVAVWMVAYLGLTGSARLVSPESLGLSLGVLVFTSFLASLHFLLLIIHSRFPGLKAIDFMITHWYLANRFITIRDTFQTLTVLPAVMGCGVFSSSGRVCRSGRIVCGI